MKHQALFLQKDKSKKIKCRLLQFLFGALRVNKAFFCHALAVTQKLVREVIQRYLMIPCLFVDAITILVRCVHVQRHHNFHRGDKRGSKFR